MSKLRADRAHPAGQRAGPLRGRRQRAPGVRCAAVGARRAAGQGEDTSRRGAVRSILPYAVIHGDELNFRLEPEPLK